MKKVVFGFVAFLLLLTFVFLNLGKWVDVTEKPVKSDIIVCLGGGTIERVKKSIELLERGYARKHLFLLIGESGYNQPYIAINHPDIPIVIDEHPKNTQEEVLFIKKYMKKHGYKSALIVTDPPHSRRVSLLTSLISVEGDETMTFRMIDSGVVWWNRGNYYNNTFARVYVKHEMIKIAYNCIAYGVLDKIGLLDEVKHQFDEIKTKGLWIE